MLRAAARLLAIAVVAITFSGSAGAQEKLKVVATFSILADLVSNVGGGRVDVTALVGPDSDAHVYSPSPADAKKLADAKAVVMNGLGYEGWLPRLIQSSGSKVARVVASASIKPRGNTDSHGHGDSDPHAWQSVANAKIYVANIRDGLTAADPAGRGAYEKNAADYTARLDSLDREVQTAIAAIPPERRRVITTHSAFGYFADAYGVEMLAPTGVSTESEPSARDVARLVAQIKRQKVTAVFLENIVDPRLIKRIADETGAKVGGTLYSDALTGPGGPAPTYIDLIRHNIRTLSAALAR